MVTIYKRKKNVTEKEKITIFRQQTKHLVSLKPNIKYFDKSLKHLVVQFPFSLI